MEINVQNLKRRMKHLTTAFVAVPHDLKFINIIYQYKLGYKSGMLYEPAFELAEIRTRDPSDTAL